MLEDTMKLFRSRNSMHYLTVMAARKTMNDLAIKYNYTKVDLFYQVFAIAQYCSEHETYTVRFDDNRLIDMLSVMCNDTHFSKVVLVNTGFVSYVKGRYIVNKLVYEYLSDYIKTLRDNFRIQSRVLNRKDKRFVSMFLLDELLFKYRKGDTHTRKHQ